MINTIIEQMEKVREALGMDANYFYTAMVTLVIALIPFVKNICAYINNSHKNNLLQLYRSEEDDFFYFKIMLIELFLFGISYYVAVILLTIIKPYIPFLKCSKLFYSLGVALSEIIVAAFIKKLMRKSVKVRKRCVGIRRIYKWLIYSPFFTYAISTILTIFFSNSENLINVVFIILIAISEVTGMWVYRGRYVRYEYSNITIYTKNGYIIKSDDITKIRRMKNVVIIEDRNSLIRIKYDDITKTEYSGSVVIKLKNGLKKNSL